MAVNDGDILKVVVTISAPSLQVMQNVYYWQLDDPTPDNPSNAQIITALDTRVTDMYDKLNNGMVNDYSVDDFTAEKIEWNVDHWETTENVGEATIGITGDVVGDATPHGVACTVTGNTSRPQTRARKFLPGFDETEMTDSTVSGAILGFLGQYIVSWLSDQLIVGSAYLIPGVVGQSGPSAGLWYDLISCAANSILGYQRRRKPGVGI